MKRSILAAVIVGLGLFFSVDSEKVGARNAPLFTLKETPQARPAGERASPASVKEADISIDLAKISRPDTVRLDLPLFDGKTYRAAREEIEVRGANDATWRGKIREGSFLGDVVLTLKNGYVSGLIYSPDSVYEIVAKGDRQILVQLDQRLFPECAGDITGDPARVSTPSAAPEAAIDSGDRIDVLVLYTTPVKTAVGGDAQAQALAQAAIDVSNTAYINSKVRQRVRLVNAQETPIAETGALGSELSTLRGNAGVAALRNTFQADLVAMLSTSNDACGIGYLMGSVAGNQNNGFTVTSRTCAVGNLSFPHELGHNMGSAHNPENGSGGTYSYSFGHWVNGSYRTVMSYVNPCTAGCTRFPYFSNPGVIFNGVPTGTVNARDNARSINNTADAIAGYRYSGSSIQLTNFNGGEWLPRSVNRTLTWSSDNITGNVRIDISRDESGTWAPLIASTPNDGSAVFSVSGPNSRRIRLRVVSVDNTAVTDSSTSNLATR